MKILHTTNKWIFGVLFIALFIVFGCTILEIEPDGSILADDALQTDENIADLTNSIYTIVASSSYMGGRYQNLSEVMGDNITDDNLSSDESGVYNRHLDFFNNWAGGLYSEAYKVIYRANIVLENIEVANATNSDNYAGQVLFLRAMGHFHAATMYAQPYGYTVDNSHLGVPIKLKTELEVVHRATVKEVYEQVIVDLKEAEQKLSKEKLSESNDGYLTTWAAKAFLSKIYFQMNDFENAYTYANDVIENSGLKIDTTMMVSVNDSAWVEVYMADSTIDVEGTRVKTDMTKVVSKQHLYRFGSGKNDFGNNVGVSESLFTLISYNKYIGGDGEVHVSYDNRAGALGVWRNDGTNNPHYTLTEETYSKATVLQGDKRNYWYGQKDEHYVMKKFNNDVMALPLLLLTEIKLIRAECLAELDRDLVVAQQDLKDILDRAFGTGNRAIPTLREDIIEQVREQRELEFIGEGVEFHDFKRRGALGENIRIRQRDWNCGGMILQFPNAEIANNPGFKKNSGGC